MTFGWLWLCLVNVWPCMVMYCYVLLCMVASLVDLWLCFVHLSRILVHDCFMLGHALLCFVHVWLGLVSFGYVWPEDRAGKAAGKPVAGKTGCSDQPGSRATRGSRDRMLTNVIVCPSSLGRGQAAWQQPGKHDQPGYGLPRREQALSTGQLWALPPRSE